MISSFVNTLQKDLLLIITHYNDLYSLKRCLYSIEKMMGKPRILIVDDFSNFNQHTDLLEIVNFPNINLIVSKINSGVSCARNVGIEFAIKENYKFATFIDCDDLIISNIVIDQLNNFDLVIYNSLEILDQGDLHNFADFKILKRNIHNNIQLELLLKDYIIAPNTVPIITSCWAKIYKTEILKKHNILFNQKMSTFEDVDFLFRYLRYVKTIKYDNNFIYAHTNKHNYKSLTFGKNNNFNKMFGFLQCARSLQKLISNQHPKINFNIKHFLGCYYSIQFIRISINMNKISDLIILYKFVNKRIESKFLIDCFKAYDVYLANGNHLIKKYIINRSSLLLTFELVKIARKRYG